MCPAERGLGECEGFNAVASERACSLVDSSGLGSLLMRLRRRMKNALR